MLRAHGYLVGAALLLAEAGACAQGAIGPRIGLEVTSDQRRRGLSWSDGRPTLEAGIALPVAEHLEVAAHVSGLRNSHRHGGADAVVDLSTHYVRSAGSWRLSGGVTGHVFPGAPGLSYAEIDGRVGQSLGPVQVSLTASYAPPQAAIGGDNLHLGAGLDVGLPGTPFSAYGQIGRSSGRVDDPVRAMRLRPENLYWDHAIGIDYLVGPLAAGLRYSATTIEPATSGAPYGDRHHGARLTGSVRVGF